MTKKFLVLGTVLALTLTACTNPLMSTPSPSPTTGAVTSSPSSVATPTPATMTFTLDEQNDSGQSGTLTLTENPNQTVTAVLALSGGTFTQPQPAHIHTGRCPNPGAVKFPLTDVSNGKSSTTIDMSLADLMASSPELAVNIHKSAAESKVYTACADLN